LKYTKAQQEQAFALYRELNVLSRVSEHLNIPVNILSKWKKDLCWDDRKERENTALALAPLNQNTNIENLCSKFGIPKEDGEVLKQIKTVEGICMAAIRNKTDIIDKLGLAPPNWDSAMKSLDICWKWRDKIFERKLKRDHNGDGSIGTHDKPNIIVAVQQTMKGDGSADHSVEITSDRESYKILPEQVSTIERGADQESA
jgi:hypothetical protein